MTSGLETFAKVRALHDRTTNPGEKAAAAGRMRTLARKAGLTVAQAVSKLDAPKPKTQAEAMAAAFNDLFNTPEARAARAERARKDAARRAAALAEYGDEDAVWRPTAWETALETACRPVVVRVPIINGEMDTLMGWQGGRLSSMPPEVREAVSRAFPLPTTVRGAWAEFTAWDKLTDDRCAFFPDHDADVRTRARTAVLEHLLDTLPAAGMIDLRIRLDWMQYGLDRGFSRDLQEDQACLDALRADIERMGQRHREQDAPPVQNGQDEQASCAARPVSPCAATAQKCAEAAPKRAAVQNGQAQGDAATAPPLNSPDPGTSNAAEFSPNRAETPVQSGHPRRTNADKRRDVLALLGQGLTDREIARRAGVSPQTVGNIRKGQP